MIETVEYTVLCYAHQASDLDRSFTSTDFAAAAQKLCELRQRYPEAVCRFEVATYYAPLAQEPKAALS